VLIHEKTHVAKNNGSKQRPPADRGDARGLKKVEVEASANLIRKAEKAYCTPGMTSRAAHLMNDISDMAEFVIWIPA